MNADTLLPVISALMDKAAAGSRLFIHQRMATTEYVGIAFNHGFTDFRGTVLMHNGIVSNPKNYCVDSYNLVTLPEDGEEAVIRLLDLKESYVNLFRIDTHGDRWDMIRLSTGTLFTDGAGNYSTNAFGPINVPVERYSAATFELKERTANRNKSWTGLYSWDKWPSGDTFAELPWELDDEEELLAKGETIFVTYDDSRETLYAYLLSTGEFYYKEKAYKEEGLPAPLKVLKTQAEYIVEECEREIPRRGNAG